MSVYVKNNAKITLNVHFDKPFLYVGDSIKGKIEIISKAGLVIEEIVIEIFITEEWKCMEGNIIKSDYYKKSLEFYKLDLKKVKNSKVIEGGNLLLSPGITFLPFDIPFSEELYPCFEYPSPNKRGFIRYNFELNINSPNYNDKASFSSFLIFLSKPINDAHRNLHMSVTQSVKKWKFFEEGNTKLNVDYPGTNFKYDSMCKLNIEIDNIYGRMKTKELKFTFKRTIIYKTKEGETKHKFITKIKRKKLTAEVGPGSRSNYEYNVYLKENETNKLYNYDCQVTPYNIELDNIDFFMPTIKGKLITCDYVIKISLYFESFVDKKHRPRIRFPIYLVHKLPNEYQSEDAIVSLLKIPKNEHTQRNKRSKSIAVNNNINENENYFEKEDKQTYLNNKQKKNKFNRSLNMGMMGMNPGMMNMGMMGMMTPGMMNMGMMNPGMMTPGMMTPGMMNMQNNKLEDDQGWTLTYVKDGKETLIKISPDKTIVEAGNIYKLKTNQKGELKFKYADKFLDGSLQLCQSGVGDGGKIFVVCI